MSHSPSADCAAMPAVTKSCSNLDPTRRRFRFLTADELTKLGNPSWLIEGVVPRESVCLLYGPPGSCKSATALCEGLAVGTGQALFGNPVAKSPVVYVGTEGHRGLAPRVDAWMRYYGVEDCADVRFLTTPIPLHSPTSPERFLSDLDAEGLLPKFIIIDTLSRCMAGADENSQEIMSIVTASLDTISKHTGATVLVLHHPNKNGDAPRGSTVLPANVDMVQRISWNRDGESLTLRCEKQRDAADHDPIGLALRRSGDSIVIDRAWSPPRAVPVAETAHMPAATLSRSGVISNRATMRNRVTDRRASALRGLLQAQGAAGAAVTFKRWMECSQDVRPGTFNHVRSALVAAAFVIKDETTGLYSVTAKGREILATITSP
jgi:hypothetical protein